MENDEVLELGAPEKPVVPKGQQPETITISKAEWERNQRERDEARQSERFWADRARNGGKPAAQVEDEPEIVETSDLVPKKITGATGVDEAIFADPEKWVEAISKGPKAIEALIKAQDYLNAKQVTEITAKMALDDLVKARHIDVSTDGTTVTLSGTTESVREHDRAVALARETDGVTRVVDRLEVRVR